MAKIKESETVYINRSEIKFAAYNPRKKNTKVVEALKKNFRKVGFMGGIQWNATTGNLIGGHKRTEAMDLIHNYDGTELTNYQIKVERIELDEKTEKEQNIFLNNKRVQGETDFTLMADLIKEIDCEAAGIEDYDIKLIESLVPDFHYGNNETIKKDYQLLEGSKDKKEHVKNVKNMVKEGIQDIQTPSHFTVVFKTYEEKADFMDSIGIGADETYLTAEKFLTSLNER